jgi:protein-S-isoprenylcysteine O-methyltransferase Ste14
MSTFPAYCLIERSVFIIAAYFALRFSLDNYVPIHAYDFTLPDFLFWPFQAMNVIGVYFFLMSTYHLSTISLFIFLIIPYSVSCDLLGMDFCMRNMKKDEFHPKEKMFTKETKIELIEAGIYRRCRHPAYLSFLICKISSNIYFV